MPVKPNHPARFIQPNDAFAHHLRQAIFDMILYPRFWPKLKPEIIRIIRCAAGIERDDVVQFIVRCCAGRLSDFSQTAKLKRVGVRYRRPDCFRPTRDAYCPVYSVLGNVRINWLRVSD